MGRNARPKEKGLARNGRASLRGPRKRFYVGTFSPLDPRIRLIGIATPDGHGLIEPRFIGRQENLARDINSTLDSVADFFQRALAEIYCFLDCTPDPRFPSTFFTRISFLYNKLEHWLRGGFYARSEFKTFNKMHFCFRK